MIVTSSLQTGDGTKIVYDLLGDIDARDRVVLIHSLAMDRTFWRPVAERLVGVGICAVALDCRGHGASGKPTGSYTAELLAADVWELLDCLKWRSAFVAGCSMGGCIGLKMAADHPDRVSGLCLIDTTAWFGVDALASWKLRAEAVLERGFAPQVEAQLARWFSDLFRRDNPHVIRSCVETFLRNDPNAYAAECQMLGEFDIRNALPFLKTPVGIVVGELDPSTPPNMSEALRSAIPHAQLRLLAGARHFTPLERPDDVAAEILAIVREGQEGLGKPHDDVTA